MNQSDISQNEKAVRSRRVSRGVYIAVPIVFVLCTVYLIVHQRYQPGFNFTESLDARVFFVDKTRLPERGDYIAFLPPKTTVYPKGNLRFMKIVLGVEGDTVAVRGREVFLNNKYVATAQPVNRKGMPLEVIKAGVVPKDHYFVWTPHKESFDSRYAEIGWVHKDRVVGTAYRVY